MAGHVLELRGCTPEPLGNYLKGLGVFRLIAEQADPQARAWWKGGVLQILQSEWSDSELEKAERQLVEWLLTRCRFTPLIAPWQKGTGYLPIGKRAAGGVALQDLLTHSHQGAGFFCEVLRDFAASVGITLGDEASGWLESLRGADPDLSDAHLLRALRNRLRSAAGLRWLDAVGMSVSRSGESDSPRWFPILANGGGEASGQYIVNQQQRLRMALLGDQERSRLRLEASLFARNQPDALEAGSMGAMYYPALMKVPNSGQGFLPDPERRVNPWDFILLLEGTLVWSMATTRRKGVTSDRASFPFYCRSSFGGSTTIGPKEVEGAEKSIAHGELWCPVWNRPSTLAEIQRIFGEGRLQVCENVCSRSLDFALAMTGFGVDRGLQAFHRYSLLERSGSGRQTTLLAVPSGCFAPVQATGLPLLVDLRDFAQSVASGLTDNPQQPRRLILARIEFERAWYGATVAAISTSSVISAEQHLWLLICVSLLERELGINHGKVKIGGDTAERVIAPLPSLQRNWERLLSSASHPREYRLARAVAGITAWGDTSAQLRPGPAVEDIRANLLPVARRGKAWIWDKTARGAVFSPEASLSTNLAGLLRRRLIEAQRGAGDGLPLWSPNGACFADLLALWRGDVDEPRLTDLIHALALIDPGWWDEARIDERQRVDETPDLKTSAVWFHDDEPRISLDPPQWLREEELRCALALPRAYHLMKLCFVGGRLPRRPVEGQTVARSGSEPYPPVCRDLLSLLEAARLPEAVQVAARRLQAKGYPAVLREVDMVSLRMDMYQCRRLAGILLIPVSRPGVLAALAVKPQTSTQ